MLGNMFVQEIFDMLRITCPNDRFDDVWDAITERTGVLFLSDEHLLLVPRKSIKLQVRWRLPFRMIGRVLHMLNESTVVVEQEDFAAVFDVAVPGSHVNLSGPLV